MENQEIRNSTSTKIGDIIQNEARQIQNLKTNIYHKRYFINCDAEEYLQLVHLKGSRIFRKKGENQKFIRDISNNDTIQQLYYYAIGSTKFKGDLRKGLWLWSVEYGTGKTTMLHIMQELFNEFNNKSFPLIECKILHEIIQNKSLEYFQKRILYFDDIGREVKEVNNFGTRIKPIPTIIHLREQYGSWTHATAQRPPEDPEFVKIYRKVTTNRLISMFNPIEFKGKTRRK